MRRLAVTLASCAVLVGIGCGVALAQTTNPPTPNVPGQGTATGQFPNVGNLKAFSAEANFMSLAGYLRYLMHQQTGQWLTYAEAKRVVTQQGGQ